MGKVMVAIIDSALIPAWKAPSSSPSIRGSGSAAEHVPWSGPGFSFPLKDTSEWTEDVCWYSKHAVLVPRLLLKGEGVVLSVYIPEIGLWKMSFFFTPILSIFLDFNLQEEMEPLTLPELQLLNLHVRVKSEKERCRWPFTHDLSHSLAFTPWWFHWWL